MPRARRTVDARAAEYVDRPVMYMRIRDGRRLVVRVSGNYGEYRTEVNLAAASGDSCTCPSEAFPCKHVRAVRETWRVNARSFFDVQNLLKSLAQSPHTALLAAIRTIVMAHPESLRILGVPGFAPVTEAGDADDDLDESEDDRGPAARVSRRRAGRLRFTVLQGRYLGFVHYYTLIHGRPPAEADMQAHFGVTAPSVHRMVLALERRGLISRKPGTARSIRLRIDTDEIPQFGA
jgi:hypothetical protein